MSRDDIIYCILLFSSIPFGHLVKTRRSSQTKQIMCTVAGLLIAISTVGLQGIWHSLVAIVGNFLVVTACGPRFCHLASFAFVFGYLFFFRTCTWYGLPRPPSHCNAIQLLVTLRMVGLAFEINSILGKEDKKDVAESECNRYKALNLIEYLSYGYCYCGLMTGPFYKYGTYKEMLEQDGTQVTTIVPALQRLKYLPLYAIPYVILNINFPLNHMESVEFLNHRWGILYQLAYLVPAFHWFRWRFYIGWLLAEAMCMTLGLGAYPFECEPKPGLGPSKPIPKFFDAEKSALEHEGQTHSFETIHNIDIFNVELGATMRSVMKAWNMTVQWWMAVYVHKTIPFKSFRMSAVLLVSAFWHGVHPGYYLTFLSVPLIVAAETRMAKAIKPYLTARQQYLFDWLSWFFLYRAFEYTGVGFMLLRLESVLRVWKRMYFIGHIVILLFIVAPSFIPKKKTKVDSDPSILKRESESEEKEKAL